MLKRDLEWAETTISNLRKQVLMLQARLSSGDGAIRPYAGVLRQLQEDVDHLVRQLREPSYQTELANVRIQTIVRSL